MHFLETCFPLISKTKLRKKFTEVQVGEVVYLIVKKEKKYFAYPSTCPHRGASLKFGKILGDGSIKCPYHGWKIHTDGKVDHPYEKKFNCSAEVYQLEDRLHFLWMNKNNLTLSLDLEPHLDFAGSMSHLLSAPFHVVLDNFNEGSHTAFVHKIMGSLENQVQDIDFHWEDRQDHVYIKYFGPQRPNMIFNGPFWKTYLNWDIFWTTHTDPVYMNYRSKWRSKKTGKKMWLENQNIYFIIPCGKDKTWLHSFTYTEIPPFFKLFSPLIKLLSKVLTTNQIVEDEKFYKVIKHIPFSFKNMRLDKFDHPLIAIRKKVNSSYFMGADS